MSNDHHSIQSLSFRDAARQRCAVYYTSIFDSGNLNRFVEDALIPALSLAQTHEIQLLVHATENHFRITYNAAEITHQANIEHWLAALTSFYSPGKQLRLPSLPLTWGEFEWCSILAITSHSLVEVQNETQWIQVKMIDGIRQSTKIEHRIDSPSTTMECTIESSLFGRLQIDGVALKESLHDIGDRFAHLQLLLI